MKKKTPRLIKLVSKCIEKIRELGIRRYSSKFSPKKYSQHQHLALLVLKEHRHTTYRSIIEDLEVMDKVIKRLRLKSIPHYTTLQKFMKRIGNAALRQLVEAVAGTATAIGVDATGFSSSHASRHYEERIDRQVERRSFTKLSIAVDLHTQLIVAVKARKAPSHDNGTYRKKAQRSFDRTVYHQRSKVETVFSVLKRCFGDSLRSRSQRMRNKELSLKCLTYNVYKVTSYRFYWPTYLFYRAPLP